MLCDFGQHFPFYLVELSKSYQFRNALLCFDKGIEEKQDCFGTSEPEEMSARLGRRVCSNAASGTLSAPSLPKESLPAWICLPVLNSACKTVRHLSRCQSMTINFTTTERKGSDVTNSNNPANVRAKL